MKKIKNIKETNKSLEHFNNLSRAAITPFIFSLNENETINQLIDSIIKVNFDLEGNGKSRQWLWVKSNTAFLVWDPQNSGEITSGRQMFGSVTWWIFFENGYQALDILDDNRDGQLEGSELNGIRAWFDKNSNGTSELGEVVDLTTLQIKSIGTKPNCMIENMPVHKKGITLMDGSKLPTYDWVTKPYQR